MFPPSPSPPRPSRSCSRYTQLTRRPSSAMASSSITETLSSMSKARPRATPSPTSGRGTTCPMLPLPPDVSEDHSSETPQTPQALVPPPPPPRPLHGAATKRARSVTLPSGPMTLSPSVSTTQRELPWRPATATADGSPCCFANVCAGSPPPSLSVDRTEVIGGVGVVWGPPHEHAVLPALSLAGPHPASLRPPKPAARSCMHRVGRVCAYRRDIRNGLELATWSTMGGRENIKGEPLNRLQLFPLRAGHDLSICTVDPIAPRLPL